MRSRHAVGGRKMRLRRGAADLLPPSSSVTAGGGVIVLAELEPAVEEVGPEEMGPTDPSVGRSTSSCDTVVFLRCV